MSSSACKRQETQSEDLLPNSSPAVRKFRALCYLRSAKLGNNYGVPPRYEYYIFPLCTAPSGAKPGRQGMARQDPLNNCRFRVEIDGIQTASFSEVSIGATATDVIDYREGT